MATTIASPTSAESVAPPNSRRRGPEMEHELFPNNASWLDLMPKTAGRASRLVFACLEYGVLEAWQDAEGTVRLYLPESSGGHLIVAGPEDGMAPPNLTQCSPHHEDPDALIQPEGAAWITLLPGIRRARTRPKPPMDAAVQEADRRG